MSNESGPLKPTGIKAYGVWMLAVLFVLLVGVGATVAVMALAPDEKIVPNYVLIVQTSVLVLGLGTVILLGMQLATANRQAASSAEQLKLTADHLALTASQLQQTAKWNKTLSYHQFFGDLVKPELAEKVRDLALQHGFATSFTSLSAMTQDALNALLARPNDAAVINTYLDEFEEFCAAVKAGIVEDEYAYGIEATRVIRAAIVFEPFIRRSRADTKYSRAHLELETLGSRWKTRREKEEAEARDVSGVKQHV